jgi:methanogenic corrinoid protein MtbC1
MPVSFVTRTFLWTMGRAFELPKSAPNLIVTTPLGQMYECGALMVAATAASEGWRVTYLGPNLPAAEIAEAVRQNQAKAVALSLVYPADDPTVRHELETLRHSLPAAVVLLVGGRVTDSYHTILEAIGAVRLQDMWSLRATLHSLRAEYPPAST